MFDFLASPLIQNVLLLGILLAVSAALLSPFLVLNQQSMIADGLSHVAFTGIIFGVLLFSQPLYFAIPFAVLASFAITFLGEQKMMHHDAAIGVVSAFSLAVGLIVVSLSDGFNRSIESLLVGMITASTRYDVYTALVLLVAVLIFVLLFYRPLLSSAYDLTHAKVTGVKHKLLKYALSSLSAVFIVIGVRTVGMLLISAYLIFPALIASQYAKSFKSTLIISALSVIGLVFIAIWLSYVIDIPTGSTIVVVYTFVLLISILIRKVFKGESI
ncbi:MAG TPA: metal ABC transporter permease [Acholeplasma sp.]|nr:metal ABC transporter permease [Acholeplasma sp.]